MAKESSKKTAAKTPAKKAAAPKAECKKAACKTAAKAPVAKVVPVKKAAPAKVVDEIKKARKVTKPKNEKTNSFSQAEFIENVRAFCGLAKKSEAKVLCDDLALLIKDALKRGYKLPIFGLGKVSVCRTKARAGRNPATGETIQIPSKKKVRFTAAKALKDAVL